MVKQRRKQRFLSLLCTAAMIVTGCTPVMAADVSGAAVPQAAVSETAEIASIDFNQVEGLDSLDGWTVTAGAGKATLEEDTAQGKVLKLSHPSNGDETNLTRDALGIDENTYRYVSVETVLKLDENGHANQISIPYLSDSAGKNAYTLLAEGDWSEYKSHVTNSSTKLSAGPARLGQWQAIRMDIDLKEDTFRVSVDGAYLLAGANARKGYGLKQNQILH